MVRRRLIGLAAIATAVLLAACGNPAVLMDTATKEVKAAKDMNLLIESASPSNDASNVNPNAVLHIDFDRALDTSTIKAAAIVIVPSAKAGSASAVEPWTWSYDKALKRLYIKPSALEGGVSYLVTIGTGLRSAAGEPLGEEFSWNFTTAKLPGGTITITGSATITNNANITLSIDANDLVDKYFYSYDKAAVANPTHSWWALSGSSKPETMGPGDGTYTVYYQFKSVAGAVSDLMSSNSIIFDTTAPNAPTITAPATDSHAATWTWVSGGNGGNGVFKYSVDGGAWTGETSSTSYASSAGLADGAHSIQAQERDAAGNWSGTATANVTIDAPPNAPTVSVSKLSGSSTTDISPTWSWSSGGFGNGDYKYSLDSAAEVPLSATSMYPDLADGLHTLTVSESDGVEWSAPSAQASVRVTPVIPYSGQTGVSTLPKLYWRGNGVKGTLYTVQIGTYSKLTGFTLTKTLVSGLKVLSYQVTEEDALAIGTVYWRVLYGSTYIPSVNGARFTVGRYVELNQE